MAQQARVIVADYFHIFDLETQRILFSKLNKKLSKTIIIVDEAHNLPDRIRNDWTLKLNKFILKDVAEQFKENKKEDMEDLILSLNKGLTDFSSHKLGNENEVFVSKNEIVSLIENNIGKDYSVFLNEISEIKDDLENRENNDAFLKLFL